LWQLKNPVNLSLIAYASLVVIGNLYNLITSGKADPYALEDCSTMELLPPVSLLAAIVCLLLAWRWELLFGMFSIIFVLTAAIVQGTLRSYLHNMPNSLIPLIVFAIVMFPAVAFVIAAFKGKGEN